VSRCGAKEYPSPEVLARVGRHGGGADSGV
jgi:hypothetical protein